MVTSKIVTDTHCRTCTIWSVKLLTVSNNIHSSLIIRRITRILIIGSAYVYGSNHLCHSKFVLYDLKLHCENIVGHIGHWLNQCVLELLLLHTTNIILRLAKDNPTNVLCKMI